MQPARHLRHAGCLLTNYFTHLLYLVGSQQAASRVFGLTLWSSVRGVFLGISVPNFFNPVRIWKPYNRPRQATLVLAPCHHQSGRRCQDKHYQNARIFCIKTSPKKMKRRQCPQKQTFFIFLHANYIFADSIYIAEMTKCSSRNYSIMFFLNISFYVIQILNRSETSGKI